MRIEQLARVAKVASRIDRQIDDEEAAIQAAMVLVDSPPDLLEHREAMQELGIQIIGSGDKRRLVSSQAGRINSNQAAALIASINKE